MARPTTHDELVRKSRGITSAHKRAADLEQTTDQLRDWLRELSTQLLLVERTAAKVPELERTVKEMRAELTEMIRGNAGNPGSIVPADIGKLEERIGSLAGDLAVLTDRVNNQDLKLANHGERIEAVEVCSNANASAIATLRQRVNGGLNPVVLVIALVAAVGAGVFMALYDWTKEIDNTDGTTTTLGNPALDSWFGIGLGALAAFMLVLAIAALASAFGRDEDVESTSAASASAQSRVAVVRDPSASPTAVHPVIPPPPPAPRADAGQPVG